MINICNKFCMIRFRDLDAALVDPELKALLVLQQCYWFLSGLSTVIWRWPSPQTNDRNNSPIIFLVLLLSIHIKHLLLC